MLSSGQFPDLLNNLAHRLLSQQLMVNRMVLDLPMPMAINKIESMQMIKIEIGELKPMQGLIIS
jgi:hypothetical protein